MTTTLTFDEILEKARLPERHLYIQLDPTPRADLDRLMAELDTLVDGRGNLLPAAPEGARPVDDVLADIREARSKLEATNCGFHVRGRSSEEWEKRRADIVAYVQSKGDSDSILNSAIDELVAACAVEPKMTAAQVAQLRSRLGAGQTRVLIDGVLSLHIGSGTRG